MDAGTTHTENSWFLRLSEHTVRAVAMALVLTGQMLPSGAVSAQDDPPFPTLSAPPAVGSAELSPTAAEHPPVPPVAETVAPVEVVDGVKTEEALPPEATTEPTPVESPAAHQTPVAPLPEALPAAPSTAAEEAPAPAIPTADTPVVSNSYQLGEWTMTIRPGAFPARPAPEFPAPSHDSPVSQQNNMSVPVTVNVNNVTPQLSQWYTPWGNSNYWNSPTSAYLFQRPQPYWQLRGDFYHLRPFIPGLWY